MIFFIGVFGILLSIIGIFVTLIISMFDNGIGFMLSDDKKYHPLKYLFPLAAFFAILCAVGRIFMCDC